MTRLISEKCTKEGIVYLKVTIAGLKHLRTIVFREKHVRYLLILRWYFCVNTVLVPHVNRVTPLRHGYDLIEEVFFEIHRPVPPGNWIEILGGVHGEILAILSLHILRPFHPTNTFQQSKRECLQKVWQLYWQARGVPGDHARAVVAPIVAPKILAEILQAALRMAVPDASGTESQHASRHVDIRFGASEIAVQRLQIFQYYHIQIQIKAAVFE